MPHVIPSFTGKDVLIHLASIYPQLYLAPGPESAEAYHDVVARGNPPSSSSLSHFRTHEEDSLVFENTPAGQVCIITMTHRQDFECFFQIMAKRCQLVPVPPTQGAAILDGVINWQKIRAHQHTFFQQQAQKGCSSPDWNSEFRRFTSEKSNYTDALIILSQGPYSAVPAEKIGLSHEAWTAASYTIRKYHECTHFITRRLFPALIDPLWDEMLADAVGLYAAFGHYDIEKAEMFLGIGPDGYTGGRLENYIPREEGPRMKTVCDAWAQRMHRAIARLAAYIPASQDVDPFTLAIQLEERKFTL